MHGVCQAPTLDGDRRSEAESVKKPYSPSLSESPLVLPVTLSLLQLQQCVWTFQHRAQPVLASFFDFL